MKGGNTGFAKLEARNGQCKIQVSVKKVYMGRQEPVVYLLSEQGELPLGKLFLRNGAGEFRSMVSAANVSGSGLSLDAFYGLTIHEPEDAWRTYTTIWEDAVAHAAEVELCDATSEAMEAQLLKELPGTEITEEGLKALEEQKEKSVMEALAEELEAEPETAEMADEVPEPSVSQETYGPEEVSVSGKPSSKERGEGGQPVPEPPQAEVPQKELERWMQRPWQSRSEPEPQPEPQPEPKAQPEMVKSQHQDMKPPVEASGQPVSLIPGLIQPEEEDNIEKLWLYLSRTYPKIQAFDYQGECEILTIKPQDIGLLPREVWSYGNNSFLLHGYYNHRYLILARLRNSDGSFRFLLGVPGHYFSNEKYMASMFGFPNFVLSKMQPAGDERFGYWYTDVHGMR